MSSRHVFNVHLTSIVDNSQMVLQLLFANTYAAFRVSTNSFHMDKDKNENEKHIVRLYYWKINKDHIITILAITKLWNSRTHTVLDIFYTFRNLLPREGVFGNRLTYKIKFQINWNNWLKLLTALPWLISDTTLISW